MALENNFYQEIQDKEKKWIELIEKNLLNIYYFKVELEPFYIKKLEELTYEYDLTNNKIIGEVIDIIKSIIKKLEDFDDTYRMGKEIDIKTLVPLFLISNFNNNVKKDNNDLQRLQIRKQVLEAVKNHYDNNNNRNLQDDYLYDDFPQEHNKSI